MNNDELGFKNNKVKFSNEVEQTQSAKRQTSNLLDVISAHFFGSNRRQEMDDSHSYKLFIDSKTPSLIKLDSCDIKLVSLLNICNKTKLLKKSLTVLFDTISRCSRVKAGYYHLGGIWRRRHTFVSTPNGTFASNKESETGFNFTEFSKSEKLYGNFMFYKEKSSYDVIVGHNLMKELEMDVLYLEYVVVFICV